MRRLRHTPPMMRTVLGLVRRTDDDDRELRWIDAPRKGALDLREGHAFDAGRKLVEPGWRQPAEPDHAHLVEDLAIGIDSQAKASHQALFSLFQRCFPVTVRHDFADDRSR